MRVNAFVHVFGNCWELIFALRSNFFKTTREMTLWLSNTAISEDELGS